MRTIRASEGHVPELATLQKMYMEHHAKLDDYFTLEDDASAHWIEYMKKFLKKKEQHRFDRRRKKGDHRLHEASIYTRRPTTR